MPRLESLLHTIFLEQCICTFYDHVCFTELSVPTSNCPNATLRIVDGPSHLEGRLEVCLNDVWGTVCESSWGNNNAAVACRQLGYQPTGEEYFTGTLVVFIGRYSSCLYFLYNFTGVATATSFYGSGIGPLLMTFYCTGIEKSIFDCDQRPAAFYSYCHDGNTLGIKCEGKGIIVEVYKLDSDTFYRFLF